MLKHGRSQMTQTRTRNKERVPIAKTGIQKYGEKNINNYKRILIITERIKKILKRRNSTQNCYKPLYNFSHINIEVGWLGKYIPQLENNRLTHECNFGVRAH